MKKTIATIGMILTLTACSQTAYTKPVTEDKTTETSYENKELGIKFKYSEIYTGQAVAKDNKVVFQDSTNQIQTPPFIQVFTKPADQKIDDAILDVVKKEKKDSSKCKVIDGGKYWAKDSFQNYTLDLVNKKLVYTKDEEKEIKQSDLDSKKDGGPFDGEWQKADIYKQRLIQDCSSYANNMHAGTSKTFPSIFLYDAKDSNTKFIFIPGSADPYFFKEDSLEILK